MWLFVMFDLPVGSREERKNYAAFRAHLLHAGFSALQKSVYAGNFKNDESARAAERKAERRLPPRGNVAFLRLTDAQFATLSIFENAAPASPPEALPECLIL